MIQAPNMTPGVFGMHPSSVWVNTTYPRDGFEHIMVQQCATLLPAAVRAEKQTAQNKSPDYAAAEFMSFLRQRKSGGMPRHVRHQLCWRHSVMTNNHNERGWSQQVSASASLRLPGILPTTAPGFDATQGSGAAPVLSSTLQSQFATWSITLMW